MKDYGNFIDIEVIKVKRMLPVLIIILMFLQGCMYAVRYDGTYRGRVIDAETGNPIEGAVVLGVWNKVYAGAGGGVTKFYDARETLTDERGEFKIDGMGLRVMSNLEPMNILIFKAGYSFLGLAPWEGLKESYLYSKRIKWENGKPIIPLKKLEGIDLRRYGNPPSPPHGAPKEKIKLILGEINKFRKSQGWGTIDVGR